MYLCILSAPAEYLSLQNKMKRLGRMINFAGAVMINTMVFAIICYYQFNQAVLLPRSATKCNN